MNNKKNSQLAEKTKRLEFIREHRADLAWWIAADHNFTPGGFGRSGERFFARLKKRMNGLELPVINANDLANPGALQPKAY